MWAFFLFSLLSLDGLNAIPIRDKSALNEKGFGLTSGLKYLTKFGYNIPQFEDGKEPQLSQERVEGAIRDFQEFAGLEVTGILDDDTVELMKTPRCGVKDRQKVANYELQGSRWYKRSLTYRVSKYTSSPDINKSEIDLTVDAAFRMWEDQANISFSNKKEDSSEVDIDIRFEMYRHGDDDPFDGPSGTLAHAFFPQFGGDLHMDDSEAWSVNSYRGINALQTLTHEIGHSLGLEHSWDRSSVMAPFYRAYQPKFKLEPDDIEAIQALYGEKGVLDVAGGDGSGDDDDDGNDDNNDDEGSTEEEDDEQSLTKKLQNFLRSSGFNPGQVDGSWSGMTTRALQQFLNSQGAELKVDGDFGRFTTKTLQWYLSSYWSAGLTLNGRFGSRTKKALLDFLLLSNVNERNSKHSQK